MTDPTGLPTRTFHTELRIRVPVPAEPVPEDDIIALAEQIAEIIDSTPGALGAAAAGTFSPPAIEVRFDLLADDLASAHARMSELVQRIAQSTGLELADASTETKAGALEYAGAC